MDSFEISSDSYDPSMLHQRPQQPANPQPSPQPKQPRPKQPSQPQRTTVGKEPLFQGRDFSRWKIFGGIFLIIVALYLLIASISYFANGADDQSIVEGNSYSHIAAESDRIGNSGGPFGAFMAHLMISRWLGLGSFILIFYTLALGLTLLKVKKFRFWHLTYKCLLSAITLSVLAGFVTYATTSFNYWGGDHGHIINSWLMSNAGIWGAIAVNILLVAAVVLVFLREIQVAWNLYRYKLEAHRVKLARERAEAEIRRRQMEEMLSSEPLPAAAREERDETESEPIANPASNHTAYAPTMPEPNPYAAYMPKPTEERREERNDKVEEVVTPVATAPAESVPTIEREQSPAPIYAPTPAEEQPYQPEYNPAPVYNEPQTVTDPTPQEIAPKQPEPTYTPVMEPTIPPVVTTSEPAPVESEELEKPVEMTVTTTMVEAADNIMDKPFDPTATLSRFRLPSIELLTPIDQSTTHVDAEELEENKERLTKTLETFGVKLSKIEATIGPTITRYEIIPAEGVRTRSVRSLGDDLALALAAEGIRIIAPIPGKGTIGIEVPNKKPQIVGIRSILSSEAYQNSKAELPIAMGSTITNEVYVADLAKLPHLLVAGATGTGKSVGLNTIIASLLYKKHPAELKFVFIDPKRVELTPYRELNRHYLAALPGEDPVITDTSKVVTVLNSLCVEMGNRLDLLEKAGVRNIKEYNQKFLERRLNPNVHRFLPYIVLVIDEFADIILTAGKEVENPVSRLAAVARAAGIHVILATQRPTVNVITGGIKTNIPGRIAFRVNQAVDSRTILDTTGANQLAGKGDMLFSQNGIIERVQCAFIDTPEVQAICDSISEQIGYDEPYELPEFVAPTAEGQGAKPGNLNDRDPYFEEAARMVVEAGRASTTELQRKLQVGFGRAGRIMDQLEIAGIVGPQVGAKPRSVLMDYMALEQYLTPRAQD